LSIPRGTSRRIGLRLCLLVFDGADLLLFERYLPVEGCGSGRVLFRHARLMQLREFLNARIAQLRQGSGGICFG
jgi:hypothetical protein